MRASGGDYSVKDSILTVAIGGAVGIAATGLLLITGWTAVTSWSALVAAGYFITMLAFRAMDRRRGRPVASLGAIVAGSIASGVALLALARLWEVIAGL